MFNSTNGNETKQNLLEADQWHQKNKSPSQNCHLKGYSFILFIFSSERLLFYLRILLFHWILNTNNSAGFLKRVNVHLEH